MKTWLIVLACIVAYAGYYMTTIQLPEGISNPWQLRIKYLMWHIVMFVWGTVEKHTTWRKWDILQTITHWSAGMQKMETDVQIEETDFAGVRVKLYIPPGVKTRSAIVYYHGGGWTIGSVDTVDHFMRIVSSKTDNVIASVGYRLAPKYPYPAAFEDCEKATQYFLDNLKKYNVDTKRVALMGASAGGNLAAALALKFRGKYTVKLQILLYPVVQGLDMLTPSYQSGGDPFLTPRLMCEFLLNYALGGEWDEADLQDMLKNNHTSSEIKKKFYSTYLSHDLLPKNFVTRDYRKNKENFGNDKLWKRLESAMLDPYFAPLLATDLRGLPEAHIITAGMDVLRDEGFLYAKRLEEANVKVSHVHIEHIMHGFFHGINVDTKKAVDALVEYIRKAL